MNMHMRQTRCLAAGPAVLDNLPVTALILTDTTPSTAFQLNSN